MSYTALYRKFRPDNFDDVKGQDHIVRRTVSDTPICSAAPEEPVRQPLQKYWRRQ